jgi:hypothetical protein
VATYGNTETAGQEPLRAAPAELGREPAATRVPLTGLSEPEVGEQLRDITGWAVPAPVAPHRIRVVYVRGAARNAGLPANVPDVANGGKHP